jgi:hypothetical protein
MATGAHDPTRPTIYLDQSTLVDAFQAWYATPKARDVYRPLRAWVERVAHEANLCLSSAHLTEIARYPEEHRTERDEFIAWLDSMPVIWARSWNDIIPEEATYWTRIALGVDPMRAVEPFTSDVHDSFAAMTDDARRIARESGDGIKPYVDTRARIGFDREIEFMIGIARTAYVDNSRTIALGYTKAQRMKRRLDKQRADIESLGNLAAQREPRLVALADPRRRKIATPGRALVTLSRENPQSLPSWRMRSAFSEHLTERYRVKVPETHDSGDLLGDFLDYQHAMVAPAYCDHFTCDGKVAAGLAGVRGRLGKRPPIKVRYHPGREAGFVAELMATFP